MKPSDDGGSLNGFGGRPAISSRVFGTAKDSGRTAATPHRPHQRKSIGEQHTHLSRGAL